MAQALFKKIRQQYPDASIDVMAPAWSRAVLARMPEVARVWDSPGGHGQLALRARYRLARQLRSEQYSWAIVLRNSWKAALIPYWAHIPKRTGWLGEWRFGLLNDWRRLDKQRYPRMVDRFCALAAPADTPLDSTIPLPSLTVTSDSVAHTLTALQLMKPTQPLLILCPGAEYGPAKRWPAEHFARVAEQKLQQGWAVWLVGSAKDASITAAINVAVQGRCLDLAGKTQLNQVVDLLSLATQVISNDSGLMHIAAAVGVKLLVLYGSSSPRFTPPLTDNVSMLTLSLPCSPCFKRECPLTHTDCLRRLTPELVLSAME